jgi:predicted acetyltransferase
MRITSTKESVFEEDSGLVLARPEKRFISSYIEALQEGMGSSRFETVEEEIQKLQSGDTTVWKYFSETDPNSVGTESFCMEDMFWLTKKDMFIGYIVLREDLGPEREKYGGNTGRVFRPTERNKGFGTIALEMTKALAKNRGFSDINMVTRADNIAARRPWEKCGAELAEVIENPPKSYYSGPAVKYRIQL